MANKERVENVTRETILMLLSDDEVGRVSTAETATRLVNGDEYVDLRDPDHGVLTATGLRDAPMGHVLPRRAVREETWRRILALLSAHRIEHMHGQAG